MLKLKYIAVAISGLLLCSCSHSQINGTAERGSPDNEIRLDDRGNYKTLNGDRNSGTLPHQLKQGDTKVQLGETPSLEGGTEKKERPKSPANNRIMARLYPDIVALNGPYSSKRIAITFDDGPDRRFTPQVLDILNKHHVKATFFLMGSRMKGHPDITERIHLDGHAIGNHTFWHPKLYSESLARMVWEVEETDQWMKETIGYVPHLFRAPYGGLNNEVVEKLGEMGKSVIGWSVDSLDWKQIPAAEVKRNVLKDLHPGAIILMHSAGDWTQDLSGMTAALDELLPKLKEMGYELVTVPELLAKPNELKPLHSRQ